MILDSPVTAPLHMPPRPVFDDAAATALREALVPAEGAGPGDIVGVILPAWAIVTSRRGSARFCVEGDHSYVSLNAHGGHQRCTWRRLPAKDAPRMAHLSMTLASGRNPLLTAGAEPVVDAMLDESDSFLPLELLITPGAVALAQDDWMEAHFGFGDDDPGLVDMCFALLPHQPADSAHGSRRIARDLAADYATLAWFLRCDGTDAALAPALDIPPLTP